FYDFQLFRLTDLVRRKIKSAFPWPHSTEVNFSIDSRWLQVSHNALRAAHPDLRPRHGFGIDFQVSRKVMELNGNVYRDFGNWIACNRNPQSQRPRQCQYRPAEVLQHVPMGKIVHSRSLLGLTRDSASRASGA